MVEQTFFPGVVTGVLAVHLARSCRSYFSLGDWTHTGLSPVDHTFFFGVVEESEDGHTLGEVLYFRLSPLGWTQSDAGCTLGNLICL